MVSLWLFAAVRGLAPHHTPDIGRLLREPGHYISGQLPYLAGWAAGTYVAALALALGLGMMVPHRRSGIRDVSSWWLIFGDDDRPTSGRRMPRRELEGAGVRPPFRQYVGCDLVDGSYLGGYIYAYSAEVEETLDRDIVLVAPIRYVPAEPLTPEALTVPVSDTAASGGRLPVLAPDELSDTGVAIVSASRIKFMTVTNVLSGAGAAISPADDKRTLRRERMGTELRAGLADEERAWLEADLA